MTPLAKSLIAGTALLILMPSLTCAQTSTNTSNVLNGQIDLQSDIAKLNTQVTNIAGNVASSADAGGNNVQIYTMNDTNVLNTQIVGNSADIVATQNANVQNAGGTVDLQAQAICNGTDISTDPHNVNVNSYQECDATDPYAQLNANVDTAGNDTSLLATAIGNTFSEDTNAPNTNIITRQLNTSTEEAVVNSAVKNVYGNLSIGATAVGNTATIVHY